MFESALPLVALQLVSRCVSFVLASSLYRLTLPSTVGTVALKLEPVLSTILFLSRDTNRLAAIRSSSSSLQPLINLAYLSLLTGFVIAIPVLVYSTLISSVLQQSTLIYLLAALVELFTEPFYINAIHARTFKTRAKVEAAAWIVRCITVLSLSFAFNSDPNYALLPYSLGQLVNSLTLLILYSYLHSRTLSFHIPRKLITNTYLAPNILSDVYALSTQSLLKHFLAEIDKVLLLILSLSDDQGVYTFVANLGSLVSRVLFQPLEEACRASFSKSLEKGNSIDKKMLSNTLGYLKTLMKAQAIFGLVLTCFGVNYTGIVVEIIGGSRWALGTAAPRVMSAYLFYIPVMGVNGILEVVLSMLLYNCEAFFQVVASREELKLQTQNMILASIVSSVVAVVSICLFDLGTVGIILAGISNMLIRIHFTLQFIHAYYRKQGIMQNVIPKVAMVTLAVFVVGFAVTFISERYFGTLSLLQKFSHIAAGSVMALFTLYIM